MVTTLFTEQLNNIYAPLVTIAQTSIEFQGSAHLATMQLMDGLVVPSVAQDTSVLAVLYNPVILA